MPFEPNLWINASPLRYVLPDENVDYLTKVFGFEPERDMPLLNHSRMRGIVYQVPQVATGRAAFGFLHWSDGHDLSALDDAVRSRYPKEAVSRSALHVDVTTIHCFSCGCDLIAAYPDRGSLYNSREQYLAHGLIHACRTCHARFPAAVADWLDLGD